MNTTGLDEVSAQQWEEVTTEKGLEAHGKAGYRQLRDLIQNSLAEGDTSKGW